MPVGETILRAWKFAGRNVVPLLGLGWLAAAFYGAAVAYFLGRLSDAMLVWPRPDAGSFNNYAIFYLFCVVVVTAFANAVVGLAMTRDAMEPRQEWKTAHFSVARREWGLFANLLLLYVIVIGLVAAILFAGNVGIAVSLPMIGNGGLWNGIALAPFMRGALIAIAIAAGLFLATRFGFFLTAIAAADPPARLLQAWMSSRRNFWRLLAISLALLLPVVVLSLLADWAILGGKFTDAAAALFSVPANMNPLFQVAQDKTGIIATVCAVALLVWNAVFAGASAHAYTEVEHSSEAVTSRGFVPVAEPAFAMAAASHPAVNDVKRIEPGFAAAGHADRPAESLPDLQVPDARSESAGVEPMAEKNALTPQEAAAPVAEPSEPQAEEIEFKTVEYPPITAAPVMAATPTADAVSAEAPVESHVEPLAEHKDMLPVMDPLTHAAPAQPDPSGEPPATPLPAFVKTQSSPAREPSAAA